MAEHQLLFPKEAGGANERGTGGAFSEGFTLPKERPGKELLSPRNVLPFVHLGPQATNYQPDLYTGHTVSN